MESVRTEGSRIPPAVRSGEYCGVPLDGVHPAVLCEPVHRHVARNGLLPVRYRSLLGTARAGRARKTDVGTPERALEHCQHTTLHCWRIPLRVPDRTSFANRNPAADGGIRVADHAASVVEANGGFRACLPTTAGPWHGPSCRH